MGEPTPRDLTPNGVSRGARLVKQSLKADLTPMAAKTMLVSSPPTLTMHAVTSEKKVTTELEEFLIARRSEI